MDNNGDMLVLNINGDMFNIIFFGFFEILYDIFRKKNLVFFCQVVFLKKK